MRKEQAADCCMYATTFVCRSLDTVIGWFTEGTEWKARFWRHGKEHLIEVYDTHIFIGHHQSCTERPTLEFKALVQSS